MGTGSRQDLSPSPFLFNPSITRAPLIMRQRPITLRQTSVRQFVIRVGGKLMGDSFISYLRVSTHKQGRSGLGIEAQRAAVASYLTGFGATPLAEFVEVESGKRDDRPQLARALAECRVRKATLIIAKLDRLARDAHFLLANSDVREGLPFDGRRPHPEPPTCSR